MGSLDSEMDLLELQTSPEKEVQTSQEAPLELQISPEKEVQTSQEPLLDQSSINLGTTDEFIENAKTIELNLREEELNNREARLSGREAELDARAVKLDTLSAQLDEISNELDLRSSELATRSNELDTRHVELCHREELLKQREGELERREANLKSVSAKTPERNFMDFSNLKEDESEYNDENVSPAYKTPDLQRCSTIEEEEKDDLIPSITPAKSYPRQSIGQWSVERHKNNMSVRSLISSLESSASRGVMKTKKNMQ